MQRDHGHAICIAVLLIEINPYKHLYPLIRTWTSPSYSGETLLVERDGNDVFYLSTLRFRDNSELNYRVPLTNAKIPAVRAVLGQEGVFDGTDYRGMHVYAAIRTIPDTPWAIVTKIDTQELLEPVSQRIWYVIGTCLLIVLATCLAFSLWWRRKRESYLSRLYEHELNFNRELKLAEQSLQEANNRLEERVALRTEELSESNRKLRQEITERKQVEEVLRKHFQAIQQSPIAIMITDLKGTMEYVNAKFSENSGYSYKEAIGQNSRILKTEITPPEVHKQLWETIGAGRVWEGDFCNRKKNGELFWEHAKILPIKNQAGIITNFMAFKEDITKHRLLEETLLQSRKLETIGQIAGGVAHEVRNPLNAILSITEALFREKEFDNNPEFAPYIQHIRTQVNRLANLMNDLLDLGKPISAANLQALPLLELCRETLELWKVSGMAENRAVAIVADQDTAEILVTADSCKLQQVIFNLLENAGHHNPAESSITLHIARSSASEKIAIVQIIDSGKGIPEEHLTRIFDPFYSNRRGGDRSWFTTRQTLHYQHGWQCADMEQRTATGLHRGVTHSTGRKGACMKPIVLLIEDNDASRFGFVRYFSKDGYEIREAADLAEATRELAVQRFDAVIMDINLPDGNGIEFIDTIRANDTTIPIIVITGAGNIQLAVQAMQRGADNFLTKPVDNTALAEYLRKTLEIGELKRKASARQRLEKSDETFFGDSLVMQEALNLARIAASSGSPVMFTGETGTGKGMFSKWIHRQSSRSKNEFVEVNCSGLRGELLAREIFGNARGAFTSADKDRKGLLDIADHGTLFLDEIGDMSLEVQAQFLKVLEDKSYRRLGDVKLFKSDFRLICATNRNIEQMVREGSFRQDLMYRINLMTIHLPPLRERISELPEIARHLLQQLASPEDVISNEVMAILKAYSWPGNIRELKNVLERALLLTPRGATLRTAHFSSLGNSRTTPLLASQNTVQEIEEAHIKAVLEQMGGNVNQAAKALNISRATLYRRLKQQGENPT